MGTQNTIDGALSRRRGKDALTAAAPHRVAILLYPGACAYDVGSTSEVFSTANGELQRRYGAERDFYTFEVIGSVPGPITLEFGINILPNRTIADVSAHAYDTLLISGGCIGPVETAMADPRLIAWLRNAATKTVRIASLCTGSFLLAEAGVVDGAVTTHWAHCDRLQKRFPHLKVQPDHIHVKQGNIYSSAGSTAAMDLALALVEEDLGRALTMSLARRLVMFLKRAGGQSQFSAALLAQSVQKEALNGVPEWILDHLQTDLSVEALAERANMSPRNFARVFVTETGLTPAKYVERARVEKVRMMIEETNLPLASIASHAGFDSDRQMRRAFLRSLKVAPSDYAARFRVPAATFSEAVAAAPRRKVRPSTVRRPLLVA